MLNNVFSDIDHCSTIIPFSIQPIWHWKAFSVKLESRKRVILLCFCYYKNVKNLTTSLSSSIFDAKEFMLSFPIITLLTMLTLIFLSFEIQFGWWVRNDYHLSFSFITMILTHTRRKSYKFHIVYLFFQNIFKTCIYPYSHISRTFWVAIIILEN